MDPDQEAAATKLQALQRGREARKEVEIKKQEVKEQNDAAVKIQAVHRQREAKKAVEEKRKEKQEKEEQDQAAARIQALQRQKQARAEVEAKRKERQQENEAAARIQSIQRGRKARADVEDRKQRMLGPFTRPFVQETPTFAIVEVRGGNKALQAYADFEAFADALQAEFPARGLDRDHVYYSTTSAPNVFGSIVTQKKLDQWKDFCKISAVHARGELGPVGYWEYGTVKKKRYQVLREKVEGRGFVLYFEQQLSGERGESGPTKAELLPCEGAPEADSPPEGFKAQYYAKLKGGDGTEPDGTIWLRLDEDTTMHSMYRPAGNKGAKPLEITAVGKGRAGDVQEDDGKPKKKGAIAREEKEKKRRTKEIEREVALRAYDIDTQAEKLANFINLARLKVMFTGYHALSVQEAVRGHLFGLAKRDVSMLVRDYTGKSVVAVYRSDTKERVTSTGMAGAQAVWQDICSQLVDTSDLCTPVQDFEEDGVDGTGHVFIVWTCPASGFERVACTIRYDKNKHIQRHDISISRAPSTVQKPKAP